MNNSRNKIAQKNISIGLIFKVLNMVVVYLTIPFLLSFLGKENYGVWVTIFSIVNVLFFIDAGIVNGLKTKLSKSLSNKEYILSREYITTSYITIFLIASFFLITGYIFLNNVNLSHFLNTSENINETKLKNVFLITLIFIVTNFFLSVYKALFYALQKAAIVEIAMFCYQALVLVLVVYGIKNLPSSLNYIAITYGISNFIVGIIFSIIFFSKNKHLKPKRRYFKKERLNDLMSLSIDFFVIQLCMIVIFTTDNVLISNILGPEEVANYDVVLKLFQVLITLSIVVLEPYWALFSDAYQKRDFNWIKSVLKKFNRLFYILIAAVILLVLFTKTILEIWIGKIIEIKELLIYLMGVFVLVRIYGAIYMFFLNGIGKIKLQKWLYILGAIINIPLSIYLAKECNLGSSGIILGTIFSILSITIALPIQSYKILN